MLSATPSRQGDVVLVSFPFTDLSAAKKRPALVISPDPFNARQDDLVLAPITSQLAVDPYAVGLDESECQEGKLPKPSMVRVSKLFTIDSSLILRRLCQVRADKMQQILQRLHLFFS